MLSTLFFDEVDASSAMHVRTTGQNWMDEKQTQKSLDALASYPVWGCCNSGSSPVPSLRATLLWWLDRDTPLVHVMLTSNSPGDLSYSCRKMSVEIPFPRETIIACGVTHVREETTFSITWVTSRLEAGVLCVQLQRMSDHQSQLLLVPDGKTVLTSCFSKVLSAFKREADGRRSFFNSESDNGDRDIGISLSACIVASLSPTKISCGLVSTILLTDGFSLWRVDVGEDGNFTEGEFRDPIRHSKCFDGFTHGNNVNGRGSVSSWFPFWPWDGKSGAQRRYLAVSAVQQTKYIALLRCNGSLELYDSSFSPVPFAATCTLSKDEVPFTSVVHQWATLVGDDVHVVTCFGSKKGCCCIWACIPIFPSSRGPSFGQTLAIISPAASDSLVGCVTIGSASLALLWDVAVEDNACIRPSMSVGSLVHSGPQGLSGILQITRIKKEVLKRDHTSRAATTHQFFDGTDTFFCHSRALHALTSVGEELVVIEKVGEGVRAHVLAREMNPIERMVESAFAVGGPVTANTHDALSFNAIHLIPAVVEGGDLSSCKQTLAFEEGLELAASCADGAENLATLLFSALQSVPVALTLGGFQILNSAARLQGYVSSGYVDDVAMMMAVEYATTCFEVSARQNSFCSFSRRFVQHTVLRDLFSRIAYLLCSYIGWMGSGVTCATSLELPRIRVTLEFLSAAYHAVSVSGPFTSSIVPIVSETVIADVLGLLLQFKSKLGDEGEDALFAVYVANRLWRCDGALGPKASATWCKLLARRYPCLQHFRILRYLQAGRTTRSAQLTAMCLSISFHLASIPPPVAVSLLFDIGLSFCHDGLHHTAFTDVDASEWEAFLTNTSLIPSLYRVTLLCRFLYPGSVHHASVSGSLVQDLLLTDLVTLEQDLRFSAVNFSGIYRALKEVHLDVYMFLARAALDRHRFDDIFHFLEEVLHCATELQMVTVHKEQVLLLVGEVVKLATSSQILTDQLVAVTHSNSELSGILARKWCAYTARLTNKKASPDTEVMRLRSARGLYRYLCRRHAYGQAGQMMTELATVIRCCSLSHSTVEAVLEFTALAVTAVELIAPTPPLQPHEPQQKQDHNEEPSMLAKHDGTATWSRPQELSPPICSLNCEHLPWLRRRHYQAFCELKLLEANQRVDCTDLWVESPPTEAYTAAVKRFVSVLMESRFWEEALRFAAMTKYNISLVLQEHVLDLLSCTDYTTDEEALDEWYELIKRCEEFSSPLNRFGPLRSTLTVAFTFNYMKTHPALLASLERADRYEAMQALLEVFETLRRRWEATVLAKKDSEANEEVVDEAPFSLANQNGNQNISAISLWLPLVEALRIGSSVLMESLFGSNKDSKLSDASMTAGVFDPMACKARELLDSFFLLDHPSLAEGRSVAAMFLQSFEQVKQAKLAAT